MIKTARSHGSHIADMIFNVLSIKNIKICQMFETKCDFSFVFELLIRNFVLFFFTYSFSYLFTQPCQYNVFVYIFNQFNVKNDFNLEIIMAPNKL